MFGLWRDVLGCAGFGYRRCSDCWNICILAYLGPNIGILFINHWKLSWFGFGHYNQNDHPQKAQNRFYSAFYRRSPLAANIVTLAMECYTAAISIYFMVVRAIKVFLIAALYIGRIETPLFADGVGIFGPIEIGK